MPNGMRAAADLSKGKTSPYSIADGRVPVLILVLCSQPAGDVSHKPGGRQPPCRSEYNAQ